MNGYSLVEVNPKDNPTEDNLTKECPRIGNFTKDSPTKNNPPKVDPTTDTPTKDNPTKDNPTTDNPT